MIGIQLLLQIDLINRCAQYDRFHNFSRRRVNSAADQSNANEKRCNDENHCNIGAPCR
jgi:hypothetical protein